MIIGKALSAVTLAQTGIYDVRSWRSFVMPGLSTDDLPMLMQGKEAAVALDHGGNDFEHSTAIP